MPGRSTDLVDAVSAQRDGLVLRERTGTLGGQELTGHPFRWIELSEPPVVFFPDAHETVGRSGAALGTLGALTLLALCFAGVSVWLSDWLFAGIFVVVAALCGVAVWAVDRRTAFDPTEVTSDGLYLTPESLVLVAGARWIEATRDEVQGFGVRQTSPLTGSSLRHAEFVELRADGKARRVDLQPWVDNHQRAVCEAWYGGEWPLPLPR